ncbi:MAG: hypothetical protein AAFN78_04960 [Pseudomonadota bacterium]
MGYDNDNGFTFAGRTEVRNERGSQDLDQLLTVADLEYTLGAGFTLLGKARFGYTRNPAQPANDLDFSEASIGLAWRPVNSDRFNALARYTRLTNAPTAFQRIEDITEYTSDVFVTDWSLQVTRNIEWVGKAAFKLREELGDSPLAFSTSTFLSVQRLNLGLPLNLQLGTEYRLLAQKEADDQRTGWAAELTWGGIDHVRIGGGFNFTDFSDNVYSENDYSSYGWYFRLQGKY